ncbi:MAG TPA: DNA repair protein RecO C-terminal domain-containing protein [Phycisphaerae bacterium]|nr:DNA repair protein RecO C-terminal domain-containing protein [Phycisphaerae bacterium]
MANYVSDDGICLRVRDFSETSQIVGVFTRDHGLVPLIAKGIKRENKKGVVSGPLDLLTAGDVVYVPAKAMRGGSGPSGPAVGGELGTLAAWELVDHRTGLRKNLTALNAAMVCAEVTTLLVQPYDPHPELFEELEAALAMLAGVGGKGQRARTVVAYVKAALVAAGYGPQLESCLRCGKALVSDRRVRFMAGSGGFVCGDECGGDVVRGRGIEVAGRIVVALARLPAPAGLGEWGGRPADVEALGAALELLLGQVEAVTDRGVKTRYLLKSIFGERAVVPAGAGTSAK